MVKVTFLGTSGSLPTKNRNPTTIHLKYKDKSILWDCGEGTQRQMTKTNISPFKIDQIFITHLHADHMIGIGSLIQTMEFLGRKEKLMIHGPRGIKKYVEFFKDWDYFSTHFPIETEVMKPGVIHEEEDYEVEAFPVDHSCPTYGLKFQEKPGINLDKDKLKEIGLLNHPKCRELKEKGKVTHEGKEVTLEEVSKPKKRGKKIVYSSDTTACESLERASEDANLLIVDSSFGEDKKENSHEYKHGEAGEMAELAKRAEAKKLVLTHFSNRYEDVSPLEEEAREIFPNTVASEDLMKIEV